MKKMIFPLITEFEMTLPYYIVGVGCSYEQEHINRPQGFPYYQWIQSRQGCGELILPGHTVSVSENQGMLLFPDSPHEYYAAGASWEVDWIIFGGHSVEDFFRRTAKIKESGVYFISQPLAIADKISQIYEMEKTDSPVKNMKASRMTYEVLMDLLEFTSGRTDNSLAYKYNRLKPLLNYIEDSYDKPLTLTELARIAMITPQHLCHSFKEITNHTLTEYINLTRIKKSKELIIQNKNMQIKEIAGIVGFQDVSYFCAIFRKNENMSPGEFRNLLS